MTLHDAVSQFTRSNENAKYWAQSADEARKQHDEKQAKLLATLEEMKAPKKLILGSLTVERGAEFDWVEVTAAPAHFLSDGTKIGDWDSEIRALQAGKERLRTKCDELLAERSDLWAVRTKLGTELAKERTSVSELKDRLTKVHAAAGVASELNPAVTIADVEVTPDGVNVNAVA